MIYTERLKSLRDSAKRTCELKLQTALKGHDHVVNSHVIDNFELIEMTSELLNFREKYGEFEGIKE